MKTTQEQIAVMQAFCEGKKILFKHKDNTVFGDKWYNVPSEPIWDWLKFDFSIAEESEYIPYRNADEVLEDARKHGYFIKRINGGWYLNYKLDDNVICIDDGAWIKYEEALETLVWADGAQFGRLKKEMVEANR